MNEAAKSQAAPSDDVVNTAPATWGAAASNVHEFREDDVDERLREVAWPLAAWGEALAATASAAGFGGVHESSAGPASVEQAAAWLEATARRAGVEATATSANYDEVDAMLKRCAPALIVLPDATRRAPTDGATTSSVVGGEKVRGSTLLAVVGATRRHLRVLAPDRTLRRVARSDVRAAIVREHERPRRAAIERLVRDVGLSGRAARRAAAALLGRQLAEAPIEGTWLLRSQQGDAAPWRLRTAQLLAAHVCEQTFSTGAWTLLGWMTLTGRFETAWMSAWLLLLAALVPCRLATLATSGRLSLEFGAAVRRRLLSGALGMSVERVRGEGTGGLTGRILEVEGIEQFVVGGGLTSVLAFVELAFAAWLLGPVAGAWGCVFALAACVAGATGLAWRTLRTRSTWTDSRLNLTNDLVERMLGHRTTLAQESTPSAVAEFDGAFERYLEPSRRFDRATAALETWAPRGWCVAALLCAGPAFLEGAASPTTLALTVGGVMLARQGLSSLVEGLARVAEAATAWRRLLPFLAKPEETEPAGDPICAAAPATNHHAAASADEAGPAPLLEARALSFRHAGRSEPVLHGVDVVLRRGERVLLEGPSGGGKSTLAAVLAGSRTTQDGVLTLAGVDRRTWGSEWRWRVALAPQFHANHVLTGSFLFNALLGRAWPPTAADVADADRICRALELGSLIDRMPGGMTQMVGETGWQLSHGERSRLFLARALLQRADVVVLDEAFAALDPTTLTRILPRVLELAPTLIVTAHP